MEEKIRLAVFGQKRLSREGGIEIVVKELCTRMAQNGCDVTCYNRAGHHVSGAEYDKTIEYDGISALKNIRKYIDMVLNKQQLSAPGGKTPEKESVLKKLEEAKAAQTTKKTETKNHTQEL